MVMALTESLVLLVVLLSAGLTTSAFAHEPVRAAHALVAKSGSSSSLSTETLAEEQGEGEEPTAALKAEGRGGAALREFIMHAQAASKVEGVSVMPGHSRCTANGALALWLGLQLIVLALAKVWAVDSSAATASLVTGS